MLKMLKLILKNRLYNEHYPSILVTFWGETEHFSARIGALRWSILVGKQKHNVQKPKPVTEERRAFGSIPSSDYRCSSPGSALHAGNAWTCLFIASYTIIDLSRIPTNNGTESRLGRSKIQQMYENVHPSLALALLFVRTEVERGKGLWSRDHSKHAANARSN